MRFVSQSFLLRFAFAVIISNVVFTGCIRYSSTTTDGDDALSTNMTVLKKSIDSLVLSDSINVSGSSTNTNGIKSSSMEIEIINGKNIPDDRAGINALGRNIAQRLKRNVKDPDQYGKYRVLFSTKNSSAVFSVTRKVSYECDGKEL